nr:HTH domain-containing protein [Roseburia sp. AF42-8]
MKAKILAALREAEGYVSGQELCERFGVSRTQCGRQSIS